MCESAPLGMGPLPMLLLLLALRWDAEGERGGGAGGGEEGGGGGEGKREEGGVIIKCLFLSFSSHSLSCPVNSLCCWFSMTSICTLQEQPYTHDRRKIYIYQCQCRVTLHAQPCTCTSTLPMYI